MAQCLRRPSVLGFPRLKERVFPSSGLWFQAQLRCTIRVGAAKRSFFKLSYVTTTKQK